MATHRRAWKAWESIEPITSMDAIVTFQTRHTWDTWLSPLTFGGNCPRISLYSFGSRKSKVTRGSLEPWEPRDAMRARVSLAPFLSWLSVDAWKAFGSWQPRKNPSQLITCAFTVPIITFPSFLSTSPRETRRPRKARLSVSSFKAEKETIWPRWSSGPWESSEPWLSVSSWRAGV